MRTVNLARAAAMLRHLAVVSLVLATQASRTSAGVVAHPWLFVSDVHYDPHNHGSARSAFGHDTNAALFAAFLRAAKSVAPNPPVVVIGGDFLAHQLPRRDATATMIALAHAFDRAYPRAQFVIALGNNDSDCGYYAVPTSDAFLRAVASAWAPLVDRHGAAPDFVRSFARDGSYVASLPASSLRAVVINDVFFSIRFDGRCSRGATAARVFAALRETLASGKRNLVLVHVPPGVDTYATVRLARDFVVVPLMRPRARDAFVATLGARASHVALLIAGHTHRFGFRVAPSTVGDGIPMLLVPSLSPVYRNGPSFLTAPISSDGTLGNVTDYAFDGTHFVRLGDLAALGVPNFEPAPLRDLQRRIASDPQTRTSFAKLYVGGGRTEIDGGNVTAYTCAFTNFTSAAYEACTGARGIGWLTTRGLIALGAVSLAFLAAGVALVRFIQNRRDARA